MKLVTDMAGTLSGGPRLRWKQCLSGSANSCVSREMGCSDAYNHVLLKSAGLSLSQILELHAMATLLHGRS